jgi:hypothetical protein
MRSGMNFLLWFALLQGCKAPTVAADSEIASSRQPTTAAKTVFFGFSSNNDPDGRRFEVVFDIFHAAQSVAITEHKMLTDQQQVTPDKILQQLQTYSSALTAQDTLIIYSASHGNDDGLILGSATPGRTGLLSWRHYAEMLVAQKVGKLIVLTMACHSGGIVRAIQDLNGNPGQNQWNRAGRVLFVATSSQACRLSYTGPDQDSNEHLPLPGSAGSEFGSAFWRAVRGEADTNADKKLTIGELKSFLTTTLATSSPPQTPTYFPPSRSQDGAVALELRTAAANPLAAGSPQAQELTTRAAELRANLTEYSQLMTKIRKLGNRLMQIRGQAQANQAQLLAVVTGLRQQIDRLQRVVSAANGTTRGGNGNRQIAPQPQTAAPINAREQMSSVLQQSSSLMSQFANLIEESDPQHGEELRRMKAEYEPLNQRATELRRLIANTITSITSQELNSVLSERL